MKRHRIALQGWIFDAADAQACSGAKNRLLALLRGLASEPRSDRFSITLLAGRDPDPELVAAVAALPNGATRCTALRAGPPLARVASEARLLGRLARDFDLVELATLPLPRLRSRTALLLHDTRDLGPLARSVLHRVAARRALRTALARASVTMVPSTAIRDQVASLSPRRIEVVPAAVAPLPREAWPPIDHLPQGAFVSLARPEARKRLDLLVRAYALARRRSPTLPRLLLAGPPSKGWAGLAALASELGVEAAITIRNDVRDDERWPLLAAASALCFPSTLEGFGLPGVEAALVGCPVLVARGGVPHEVLGEAAITVDEGVEAWAAAMVEVTQDAAQSARSRLRLAQEEVAARYSPLRAAAAWVDAWERALAISSRAVG